MTAEILETKLQVIDTECEAASRLKLDKLYEQARYNGSKFIVPSFQEAGAVWLKLISENEHRFVSEIERVCGTHGATLDLAGQNKIEELVDRLIGEDRYINRL